jgi:hypothetical protein
MQGLRSQKKRSLHEVNEHFFDERNAAGGHYGQTNYCLPEGNREQGKQALEKNRPIVNVFTKEMFFFSYFCVNFCKKSG